MKRSTAIQLMTALSLCTSLQAGFAQNAPAAEKKAYMIIELKVTDPETFKSYAAQVQSTLDPYGGRYIVRGGKVVTSEGAPPNGIPIVIEFPSLEQEAQWEQSPAYQAIAGIRHQSAITRAFTVEALAR